MKQNRKLVPSCGLRFRGRALEDAEPKIGFSESGPQNLDFIFFGAKSSVGSDARPENVKPHSILFLKGGLIFLGRAAEDHVPP